MNAPSVTTEQESAISAALLSVADRCEALLATKTFPASRRKFAAEQVERCRAAAADPLLWFHDPATGRGFQGQMNCFTDNPVFVVSLSFSAASGSTGVAVTVWVDGNPLASFTGSDRLELACSVEQALACHGCSPLNSTTVGRYPLDRSHFGPHPGPRLPSRGSVEAGAA